MAIERFTNTQILKSAIVTRIGGTNMSTVITDGATIQGDGSEGSPLSVIPGVFDAYGSASSALSAANSYTDEGLSLKQDTLVSATNIKTINGESILGSGDIVIDDGAVTAETPIEIEEGVVKFTGGNFSVGSFNMTVPSSGRIFVADSGFDIVGNVYLLLRAKEFDVQHAQVYLTQNTAALQVRDANDLNTLFGIEFDQAGETVKIYGLPETDGPKIVYFDPATKELTYDDAPTELDTLSVATAGATITLNFNSLRSRIFYGDASFTGSKTIALSNNTNALVLNLHVTITGTSAFLTFPNTFRMDYKETRWNNSTHVLTLTGAGTYLISAVYNPATSTWQMNACNDGGYI